MKRLDWREALWLKGKQSVETGQTQYVETGHKKGNVIITVEHSIE